MKTSITTNMNEHCRAIFKQIKFEESQPIRVLDLGCGDCEFIFTYYHESENICSRIDAVDKSNKRYPEDDQPLEEGDLYVRYKIWASVLNRKLLKRGVMFFTKMIAYDFLKNTDTTYNVIILKDFLHCLKTKAEAKKHIQMCIKTLSPNGYLFMSIATDKHSNINKSKKGHKGPRWSSCEEEVKNWVMPLSHVNTQLVEKENLNCFLFKKPDVIIKKG